MSGTGQTRTFTDTATSAVVAFRDWQRKILPLRRHDHPMQCKASSRCVTSSWRQAQLRGLVRTRSNCHGASPRTCSPRSPLRASWVFSPYDRCPMRTRHRLSRAPTVRHQSRIEGHSRDRESLFERDHELSRPVPQRHNQCRVMRRCECRVLRLMG